MTSAGPLPPLPTWPFQLHWLLKGFLPPTTQTCHHTLWPSAWVLGVVGGELEPKRVTFKIGSSLRFIFPWLLLLPFPAPCLVLLLPLLFRAGRRSQTPLIRESPPATQYILPEAPHPMLRRQNNLTDPTPAGQFPPLAVGHQPQVCQKIYLIFGT